MLSTLARLIRPAAPPPNPMQSLVTCVVETVAGGIEKADNFEQRLLPSLEKACAYFDAQIAQIPGPENISQEAFASCHWTREVFAEAAEIGRAVGRSLEVKESLPTLARAGHKQVHALLGMRYRPAIGDAAGVAFFADHTLRSLAPREIDTRNYLRLVVIKRLLNNFSEHVNKLRRRERILKLEWNIRNEIPAVAPVDENKEPEYALASNELTPNNLLEGLLAWLEQPTDYFRLEQHPSVTSVDKALPLLHCSDRRQWLVCIVSFPVEEGLLALQQETHTHRHIFI